MPRRSKTRQNAGPFSDQELKRAGLFGDNALNAIAKNILEIMTERPDLVEPDLKLLQSANKIPVFDVDEDAGSPSLNADSTATELEETQSEPPESDAEDAGNPYHISDWEKKNYYRGIAGAPHLFYRSDLLSSPFPRRRGISKSMRGVFRTSLNKAWDAVSDQVLEGVFKRRDVRWSSFQAARFSTEDYYGNTYSESLVIWIMVPPDSISVEHAHDTSLDILAVLEANDVEDVVVEWIEAIVSSL